MRDTISDRRSGKDIVSKGLPLVPVPDTNNTAMQGRNNPGHNTVNKDRTHEKAKAGTHTFEFFVPPEGFHNGVTYFKCTRCGIIAFGGTVNFIVSGASDRDLTYPDQVSCKEFTIMSIIK